MNQSTLLIDKLWLWLNSGLALLVTWVALSIAMGFALKAARRFTERTSTKVDDLILSSLRGPLRLFSFYVALIIALQFAPKGVAAHHLTKTLQHAGLVLFLVWIFTRAVRAWLLRPGQFGSMGGRKLMFRMLQVGAMALAGIMLLDAFGVSITPLLASLGIGSMAVALALQDTLSNLFAGFYLQIDEPIREGDFVRLDDGTEGKIEQIGWRSTKLILASNNVVVIPNSKLTTSQIMNFDLGDSETSVLVPMGVSYKEDLIRVEKVTLEVAKSILTQMPEGAKNFEPVVRYNNFADSAIEFNVVLRARNITDQFVLRHEFIKAVHARYQQENIEIPFPQRVVELIKNN